MTLFLFHSRVPPSLLPQLRPHATIAKFASTNGICGRDITMLYPYYQKQQQKRRMCMCIYLKDKRIVCMDKGLRHNSQSVDSLILSLMDRGDSVSGNKQRRRFCFTTCSSSSADVSLLLACMALRIIIIMASDSCVRNITSFMICQPQTHSFVSKCNCTESTTQAQGGETEE